MPVLVVARPLSGADDGLEPKREELSAPGTLSLDLETGTTWELRVESDGWWAPPRYVLPGSGSGSSEALAIRLRPTGSVGAILTVPKDGPRPDEVTVRFEATGAGVAKSSIPRTSVRCDVDRLGRFQCPVPAARLNVRVRVEGFVSHYFWELEVEPDERRWLGSLRLVRGGSMVGWVVGDDGEPLAPDVEASVTASPKDAPGFPPAAARDELDLTATPNEHGFFQISGLLPGAYVLRAEADGYAVAESPVVGVVGPREAELIAPLRLRRPLDLEVQVNPALDGHAEPWDLLLVQPRRTTPVASGTADESGRWRAQDVAAGTYHLIVRDSERRRLLKEPVEVEEGRGVVVVTLERVEVEGEVFLGDEPLAAQVTFGGVTGAVSIGMGADEDGRFSGWLPRPGTWRVDVRSRRPEVFRRFSAVEVEDSGDGSPTRLRLELPDSLLEGLVVDGDGRPVEQAVVVVQQVPFAEMPSSNRVDAGGRFRFRGLSPGEYRLQAIGDKTSGGRVHSAPVDVRLPDEVPYAEARLVLEPPVVLSGRVVSEWGGVPRAKVLARPVGVPPAMLNPALTGPDGSFRINLPADVEMVDLTVQAPGYVLSTREGVRVPDSGSLTVEVHQGFGGTLRIQNLGEGTNGVVSPPRARVEHDGRPVSLSLLREWAGLHQQPTDGRVFTVPQLPPGWYTVCRTETTGSQDDRGCRGGFLTAGGVLDLELEAEE